MSNVVVAGGVTRSTRLAPVALVLAIAAVAGWIAAVLWADELFLASALVGAVAAAVGVAARRAARREGSSAGLATAAVVVGGLAALQVAAYTLVWALGKLT